MKKKECRICYKLDSSKNVISPCHCEGSIKFVHKKCIQKFIDMTENEQFTKYCSVCNSKYDFIKDNPFTFIQYICLFLACLGFLFYFTLICFIVAQFAKIIL